MAVSVLMPKLGLTMTEGVVDEWNKKEGDAVRAGEFICSISSEKLTQDIAAEADGVLLKIVVPAGETALCTAPIAYIGKPGEQFPGAAGAAPAGTAAGAGAAGSGASADAVAALASAVAATGTRAAVGANGQRVFISRLARRIALDHGVTDYSRIPGTGGRGRITRRDVEKFLAAEPVASAAVATPATPATPVTPAVTADAAVTPAAAVAAGAAVAPGAGLTGRRRAIARNMLQSLRSTAQLTLQRKVDVTKLMQFRQDLKTRLGDAVDRHVFSLNVLLLKAVALALRATPQMNSRYDGQTLTRLNAVNIGVAVALDDGLVVAVIGDVARKSLSEIARDFRARVDEARSGHFETTLLAGFTVTNLGAEGIEYFTPVLNPSETGILGVGVLGERLHLDDTGAVTVARELPLSLTFDHQVIDGAPAARFLAVIAGYLENPYRLLV